MNVKHTLSTLTHSPGVYQMFNVKNQIIYIGKALNLKKRVSSYFQKTQTDTRLSALVKQVAQIKVIVTQNENEALLLESQLIKKHQPKYNILLRDDKSYPYMILSDHAFPRLSFQRGKIKNTKNKAYVFGPYPNTTSVRETMKFLQKLFKLRVCRDPFFNHRTRPCLLYQIHLCCAPCTQQIDEAHYQEEVRLAKLLLQGKNHEVLENLVSKMNEASNAQQYENAAKLRDQIQHLRTIQAAQVVVTQIENSFDVFAFVEDNTHFAIELLMIREGRLINAQSFYPKILLNNSHAEILSAFIAQYYLDVKEKKINDPDENLMPKEVILSENCQDKQLLENLFGFKLSVPQRGEKLSLVQMAKKTGLQALKTKSISNPDLTLQYQSKFDELAKACRFPNKIERIICFDISHHGGESTVASCVVCVINGFEKNDYRQYNIQNITPGDDYAAMTQAMIRFFNNQKNMMPDLLLIDGGKGQLHAVQKALNQIPDDISEMTIMGISKGPERKAGMEKILLMKKSHIEPLEISPESPAFHLLQQIRDEAHRFAITQHRRKQSRKRKRSLLENIEGIGDKKRQALLQYLGGLQELKNASVEDLCKVPGISEALAEKIYRFFRKN